MHVYVVLVCLCFVKVYSNKLATTEYILLLKEKKKYNYID